MGIWIELHCDAEHQALDVYGKIVCETAGEGAMIGAMTLTRPGETLKGLRKEAKKAGWLLDAKTGRIACQACAAAIDKARGAKPPKK